MEEIGVEGCDGISDAERSCSISSTPTLGGDNPGAHIAEAALPYQVSSLIGVWRFHRQSIIALATRFEDHAFRSAIELPNDRHY